MIIKWCNIPDRNKCSEPGFRIEFGDAWLFFPVSDKTELFHSYKFTREELIFIKGLIEKELE